MKKNKKRYKKKVPILCEGSLSQNKGSRLKKLRGLSNLSREKLARGIGFTAYSVKGWESGRFRGLSLDGAEKILKRVAKEGVECSLEWLLHGIGVAPKGTILDKAKISELDEVVDDKQLEIFKHETLLITEELAFFKEQFKKTLDFRVEDDGMLPLYKPGEYVAGIERYKKEFSALDGLDCIVVTTDHKTYLRRLKLGSKKDRFNLECTNANTNVAMLIMYDVQISKAAPVIRHYHRDPQ